MLLENTHFLVNTPLESNLHIIFWDLTFKTNLQKSKTRYDMMSYQHIKTSYPTFCYNICFNKIRSITIYKPNNTFQIGSTYPTVFALPKLNRLNDLHLILKNFLFPWKQCSSPTKASKSKYHPTIVLTIAFFDN